MTHRRALLAALAFAVLFAAGYSMLVPHGERGRGDIEIVDVSTREIDDGKVEISATLRFPGARFGTKFSLDFAVTSAQCGVDVAITKDRRRNYGQDDIVEKAVLSPICAADDYELTVVVDGSRAQEIARDTMRFSVPPSP